MIPESHPAAFDVEVWDVESVFVQVTMVPAAMSRASGVNPRFPSPSAPMGIVTADAGPPGVGTGVGDGAVEGDEELPPQPIAPVKMAVARTRRIEIIWVLRSV